MKQEQKILFNGVSEKAIGLFAEKGGEIINSGEIKGNNTTSLEETIGMVIQPKNGALVANGTNTGTIELEGKKVTGVYNQGVFDMTAGSITTSGEKIYIIDMLIMELQQKFQREA